MPKKDNEQTRAGKREAQLREMAEKAGKESAMHKLYAKVTVLRIEETQLGQDEAAELIELYSEAGIELKKAADANKGNEEKTAYYKRMMEKLSKDYMALFRYKNRLAKAKNPKTMTVEEFFDTSRTRTVKLPETELTELEKTGAGQNVRYKVSLKRDDEPIEGVEKGDIFTGYFTENVLNDPSVKYINSKFAPQDNLICKDAHDSILAYLREKYPDATDYINTHLAENADVFAFKGTDQEDNLRLHSEKYTGLYLRTLGVPKLLEAYRKGKNSTHSGVQAIQAIGESDANYCAYVEYASMYMKQMLAESFARGAEYNTKAALGKRNALTSVIADVLGCGDLVAFSEKLKIEARENGKKVTKSGVLMMPAKGVDLKTCGSTGPFTEYDPLGVENAQLIKAAAKLQFLDYLIGNSDRHGANFFWQYDENGRMVGIMGIDNDSCFGARKDIARHNSGVQLKKLRIIPKDMADVVKAMKPEAYAMLLEGYDLSEAEKETAVNRFIEMKENIRLCERAYEGTEPGYLDPDVPRVVPDEDMGKYSLNEQLSYKVGRRMNIFGRIQDHSADPTDGWATGYLNSFNSCCDAAAEIMTARIEKGPASLIKTIEEFKKTSAEYRKDNEKTEGTFENLVAKANVFINHKDFKYMNLIVESEHTTRHNTIKKDVSYSKAYTAISNAVKAADEYLLTHGEDVLDYQNCKAEIDYYKKAGDKENLKTAQEELKGLEKNPAVKQYKLAVKIRDKYSHLLDGMDKIAKKIKEIDFSSSKLAQTTRDENRLKRNYENSKYRTDTLKRIERQNKNNHLNLPKAGAEKVEKPEAKVMK